MNSKLLKLARLVLKFETTMVGDVEWVHEGELSTGVEVYTEDENGELIPVADGEYETEKNKIVVKDGKVEEITEKQEPQEPTQEPMAAEPEPEPTPEPEPQPDEKDAKIAELEAKVTEMQSLIDEKDAKIAELEAKITELEDKLVKPVEQPIAMSATLRDGNGKTSGAMKYFAE